MSRSFFEEEGPQPPKVLRSAIEIAAHLKLLEQSHSPLLIRFEGRSQVYQSYVVAIDKERNLIALDEIIPNEGERLLLQGEPMSIEAFHEGVRLSWTSDQHVTASELNQARCYWGWLPTEVVYHQRRNTYRAVIKLGEAISVTLADPKLPEALNGELLDLSATGCKFKVKGNVAAGLRNGELYAALSLQMPFGRITSSIEMRHASYDERLDFTAIGVKFKQLPGLDQRQIERFVYQLQREAKQES